MNKKPTRHQTDIIKKNGEIIRVHPLTETETMDKIRQQWGLNYPCE